MKVCTDSCTLGALADPKHATNILDIGTGTGLLALMMAQKTRKTNIVAVEIDPAASMEAQENFRNSPWRERLRIVNMPIQQFYPKEPFDFVISNPPFFEKSLKSSDPSKNIAHHNLSLNFSGLSIKISTLISPSGEAWILLPPHEMGLFRKHMVSVSLYPDKTYYLKNFRHSPPFRLICRFKKHPDQTVESKEVVIWEKQQAYTDEFRTLLKDYYLIF